MSNTDEFEKVRCPMCYESFVNPNKLNRHKRTCPAKNDGDGDD